MADITLARRSTTSVAPAAACRHGPRAGAAIGLRGAGMVALLVLVAAVHLRRPATLCPLRALTGIPCPFCGATTAAVRLGHADIAGAAAASPLAVGLLAWWPVAGQLSTPAWWQRQGARRIRSAAIVVILVVGEFWQLRRFGLIS